MKRVKKILAGGLIVVSLFTLVACQTDNKASSDASVSSSVSSTVDDSSEESPDEQNTAENTKALVDDAFKSGNAQPGAKVKTGVNNKGQETFEYTNPDGSGGGGVALD